MPALPAWLPNAISALRVALVPAWVVCAEAANGAANGADQDAWRWAAFAVLATIGASDVLDGWLARRFGLASRTGAMLDAVADKLAQVVLFTWLALRGGLAFAAIPLWFLLLLIGRDLLLLVGWWLVRRRAGAVQVVHRAHGKLASLLLFGQLLALGADLRAFAAPLTLGGVAAFVLGSTLLYVRDGWRQFVAAAPQGRRDR